MLINRIFMAPVADAPGAGGTTDDEPKPLTHEAVHSAIGDRLKRYESKQEERFKSFEQKLAVLDSLPALLEQLKAGGAPAPTAQGAQGDGTKPPKENDEARQARIESEKLRKRLDEIEAQRQAEREQIKAQEERTALQAALTSAGIADARQQRAAMAILYTEEKRVTRNADGEIMFKTVDKYGDPVDRPLADGVKEWADSDDGKAFLPPKDARGSGAKPSPRRAGNPSRQPSREEKIEDAQRTVFEQVAEVFGGRRSY